MIDVFKAFLVGIFAFEGDGLFWCLFSDYFLRSFLAATFLTAFLVVGFLAIMTEFFRVYI